MNECELGGARQGRCGPCDAGEHVLDPFQQPIVDGRRRLDEQRDESDQATPSCQADNRLPERDDRVGNDSGYGHGDVDEGNREKHQSHLAVNARFPAERRAELVEHLPDALTYSTTVSRAVADNQADR